MNNNLVNCVTKVQCEPRTRRLAKTSYQRPKTTLTDTLKSLVQICMISTTVFTN